jgi:hypothetical protein
MLNSALELMATTDEGSIWTRYVLESVTMFNYHFSSFYQEERIVVTLTDSAFHSLVTYGKLRAGTRD